MSLLLGAAVAAISCAKIDSQPGAADSTFVLALCLTVTLPINALSIVAHELGHAGFGALAGCHIFSVFVGTGRPIFARERNGARFVVLHVPLSGITIAGIGPTVRFPRLSSVVYVMGGPLANALVALIAFVPLVYLGRQSSVWSVALIVAIVNIIMAIGNLFPVERQKPVDGQAKGTDGYLLLRILFHGSAFVTGMRRTYHQMLAVRLVNAGKPAEALPHAEALCALPPENKGRYLLGLALLSLERDYEALPHLRFHADFHDSEAVRKEALQNIAVAIVNVDDPWLLGEADEATRVIGVETPRAKFARGAVLIRTDRIDEGVALVQSALDATTGNSWLRGRAGDLLAEAAMRRGLVAEVETWVSKRGTGRTYVDYMVGYHLLRFGHCREAIARLRGYARPPWGSHIIDEVQTLLTWATLGLAHAEHPPIPGFLAEADACSRDLPLTSFGQLASRVGVLLAAERAAEAEALLAPAHAQVKRASERAYLENQRAEAAVRCGRTDDAAAWLARSTLRPHDVPLLLGESLLRDGQAEEMLLRLEHHRPGRWAPQPAHFYVQSLRVIATMLARVPRAERNALRRALRDESLAALQLLWGPLPDAALDLAGEAAELASAFARSLDPAQADEAEAASRAVPLTTDRARAARGAILLRAGRREEGLALLVEAHRQLADAAADRRAVGVLLAEAELRENRHAEAEAWLAQSYTSPAEAEFALGELMLRHGRPRLAVLALRHQAAQCRPERRDEALQSLAWALFSCNDLFLYPEAERLSAQVPLTSVQARVLRADLLASFGRFDESATLLEQAYAESQPSPPRAAYIGLLLAQVFILQGRLEPARELIEEWAAVYPLIASYRRASITAREREQPDDSGPATEGSTVA